MFKRFFFSLVLLVCFYSFSQDKNIDGVSEKFYINLIEKQKANTKKLYQSRGASLDWLEKINISDTSIFKPFSKESINIGIIVYTFENDTLKLNLISELNKPKQTEFKVAISKVKLTNYINDVNYLYSSVFFNRAPEKRGTKIVGKIKNKEKLVKSFKSLNEILFPDQFKLEFFDHLIFLPALNIGTLPFSAFKIKGKYLIDRMSYSIAPNIYELVISSHLNKIKHGVLEEGTTITYFWENALFVSNPKYPNKLDWSFPDLPGAEEEVNYVLNTSKPEKFKHLNSANATKKNIIKNICDYDLIYFATHGINDYENPMDNSFLVLADDNSDKPYLTSREIQNIRKECKLKADLVVLSACQTGLGKAHEGGTIGLARAFQIAGANHVLMSLWNIDDKETATLMKFFFDELAIGKEMMPHAALRNAVLKYKKEVNEDPKYWAAFSLFGVPY